MVEDFNTETKIFIEEFHITFLTYLHSIETIEEALIIQKNLRQISKNINESNELLEDRLLELFEID